MIIDAQITFCIPGGELFVGGRSGNGAVEDNIRLCEFAYKNLDKITEIAPTMDTHLMAQIFHRHFWINDKDENPEPMSNITYDDVKNGIWKVNPAAAACPPN